MINGESTQSYKVPLKACQNSVIDHNLVTISLSVEWPDRGGDEPNLVIDITNKQPPTSYSQQNQSSPASSVLVNSVHHHHPHQHQENVGSTHQQQYYHHHHHSLAINNHDPSSSTTTITTGDHNDVSSTTTTVVYNSIQPQLQTLTSPTTNQDMKIGLKPQSSSILRYQPTLNPSYLSSQHVIQTPPTIMNDSRLNMQMSAISPPSSTKQMPSMTPHVLDLQQISTRTCPSSTSAILPFKSLVCTCPNPTNSHEYNCPILNLNKQHMNTNLPSDPTYRLPPNRTIAPHAAIASRVLSNDTNSIPSKHEQTITKTSTPFPNHNLMNTSNLSSSSVTTIISQPSFINNPMNSTIKAPLLDTDINFQKSSLNFPKFILNNPSNYQTNPSISIPIIGQQNVNSNQQKKRPIKRNSLTNQDQTSFQNLNTPQQQQQVHIITNQNSPLKQPNTNSSNLSSSPIPSQQGKLTLQDNSQTTDNTSHKGNTVQQQSPRTTSMVRSPVEIDIPDSKPSVQIVDTSEVVEQTISEVASGHGTIPVKDTPTSNATQKQQRHSVSAQLVWEEKGPPKTKTYLSPLHQEQQQQQTVHDSTHSTLTPQNVVDITKQVICPHIAEQSKMNASPQQQTTNNNKKRNRPKQTKNTDSKRKPSINTPQSITTSPITSTSSLTNKPISWPTTPIPSSSSGCVTTTTVIPTVNMNQPLITDSWQTSDINNDNTIFNSYIHDNEQTQIIYPNNHHEYVLDDLFSSKIHEHIDSSTTPPFLPIISMPILNTSQILTPASTGKLSSISMTSSDTNPLDIYEDFFPSNMLSSPLTWQENQVTSSVVTPPDHQNNNHVSNQQHYPQTNTCFDQNLQLKTSTSQIIIGTNSNTVNQMINNDDIQTSSKQQQQKTSGKTKTQSNSINNKSSKHPSKNIKQRNRSNTIQKQTSTKSKCTRCGYTHLIDITRHEFPKQKGLVFECVSCGNSSLRSNVSADERQRRLAKVAADHLNPVISPVKCQFCQNTFRVHNEYLTHLKEDHASNK